MDDGSLLQRARRGGTTKCISYDRILSLEGRCFRAASHGIGMVDRFLIVRRVKAKSEGNGQKTQIVDAQIRCHWRSCQCRQVLYSFEYCKQYSFSLSLDMYGSDAAWV